MKVVSVYAGILAIMFVVLSVRTIRMRRSLKVGVGDGGKPEMLRAIRVHSNFAEYVPFALLLLFFVEQKGLAAPWVHALCLFLVAGRVSHAYGVSQVKENFKFRISGMVITFGVLILSSLALFVL